MFWGKLLVLQGKSFKLTLNILSDIINIVKKNNNYGALIDTGGLFNNIDDSIIIQKLCSELNRPILFIDNNEQRYLYTNDDNCKPNIFV